jgi:hypothetical protein
LNPFTIKELSDLIQPLEKYRSKNAKQLKRVLGILSCWVKVWIHLVFSTKNRIPYLSSKELSFKVFDHIKKNAEEKKSG